MEFKDGLVSYSEAFDSDDPTLIDRHTETPSPFIEVLVRSLAIERSYLLHFACFHKFSIGFWSCSDSVGFSFLDYRFPQEIATIV
jgi:hypothetical protein